MSDELLERIANIGMGIYEKLGELQDQMQQIDSRLEHITRDGLYSLGDVTSEISRVAQAVESFESVIDGAATKITGPIGYDLGDIFNAIGD